VEDLTPLRTGDKVLISGVIYTARDAAHQRLVEHLKRREEIPLPLKGQVIYYVGPTPAPPGRIIGAAGPTSSYRMDPYTPTLLRNGLKAMIGKGSRSREVREAMLEFKAVYLAAIGGAGALASKAIKEAEVIAYPELGTEAIRRMVVEDFPAIVINDLHGGDLYEEGRRRYEASGQ
jgi:fumarate hydratase subunit beta